MQADFDCLACGACCFGPRDYIDVRATDLVRMSAPTVRRFVLGERSRSMRMAKGHCAALRIVRSQHYCTIYAERPEACRSITPGNRECLSARRRHERG